MFQLVYLYPQAVGRQAENVPALGFIAAEKMKVPARKTYAIYISGTIDGNYAAMGIGKVKLALAFSSLRQGTVGFFSGKQLRTCMDVNRPVAFIK